MWYRLSVGLILPYYDTACRTNGGHVASAIYSGGTSTGLTPPVLLRIEDDTHLKSDG
jgi:hypothetical protein